MQCRVVGMMGGFPAKDAPCSGYLIEQDGFKLLLDCGSGVAQGLQQYVDINEIDHVVLSHYHYDHYSDVGVMLFARLVNTMLEKADRPLTIYGLESEEMKRRVEEVPHSKFVPYDERSVLQIGPFQVEFQKNIHPVETCAIKVSTDEKSIVYTADTSFTEDLVEFAKGTDLLISECSFYEGMDGTSSGHMNAQEVGILAEKSGAKEVLLSHLPHYGDWNDLVVSARAQGNENIRLAEVGLHVKI